MRRGTILIILAGTLVLIGSCGVNRDPVESEELNVVVTVEPPEFARTEATHDLWVEEIVLTLPIDEQGEGDDHHDGNHDGDHGKTRGRPKTLATGEENSLRVEVSSMAGRHMLRHDSGEWVEHEPEEGESHMMIRLEDARDHDDDHEVDHHGDTEGSHPHIFHLEITLAVEREGQVLEEHTLEPIFGHDGFFYGADYTLEESGSYALKVTVPPATFTRGEGTEEKWMSAFEGEVTYEMAGSPPEQEVIGSFESDEELEVTVGVMAPETLWHIEHGELEEHEPDPSATHRFTVQVRDHSSEEHAESVGYAHVTVAVVGEGGESGSEQSCEPMFDDDGYHYGANMQLHHEDDHHGDEDHGHGLMEP